MGKFEKDIIFTGAATALVTPFYENGAVDYNTFAKLIDLQINSGIDALVICGTSGEASTMSDDEHRDAIRFAVKTAAHRVPIIAGTGSNDLSYARAPTRFSPSRLITTRQRRTDLSKCITRLRTEAPFP